MWPVVGLVNSSCDGYLVQGLPLLDRVCRTRLAAWSTAPCCFNGGLTFMSICIKIDGCCQVLIHICCEFSRVHKSLKHGYQISNIVHAKVHAGMQ